MNKRKRVVAERVGMFFAEHGLQTLKDYKRFKRVPVRVTAINKTFKVFIFTSLTEFFD